MIGAISLLLAGCSSPGRVTAENDRLRKENLDLTRQVEQMKRDVQLRLSEIEVLRQQAERQPHVSGADSLVVAALKFGRYSGPIDTDRDGKDDSLRVYLHTLDQHDRFMVAAGELKMQAAVLTPGSDPRVVADVTLTPEQFEHAYRTGLTGTHYRLEAALPPGLDSITVKVTFTDAATGAVHSHEQSFRVQ